MLDVRKLLELRRQQHRKRPAFLAQDSHKKKRIRKRWVRPRGLHSKMREQRRGYRVLVKAGYRSPAAVRHLDASSGKHCVVVTTVKDLAQFNPQQHALIIGSSIGTRKRLELVQRASDQKFTMINIRDARQYLEHQQRAFADRVQQKKHKRQSREKKGDKQKPAQKTPASAAPTLEKGAAATTGQKEDDAATEKKERDKILVTKG